MRPANVLYVTTTAHVVLAVRQRPHFVADGTGTTSGLLGVIGIGSGTDGVLGLGMSTTAGVGHSLRCCDIASHITAAQ